MLLQHTTPVIAIATAPGRGAVGIVRVSGRALAAFARRLCARDLAPRVATYLPLRDDQGQVIDHGLALFFPGPHSYTGEDVLELQVHGGPVVLQLLLAHCLALAAQADPVTGSALLPGLRLARPGEFTERAFLNGKLDLAQAEAVADLIDASTEAAARSASRSLAGVFSQQVQALRDGLVNLRMLVEATLDFPEEEIDFLTQADAAGKLARLRQALVELQQRTQQGALLREGIKVVIAGQPNAGKSSLLNALAGAELAIVTPIAGTTRDKVSQTIQIEGVPLHIVDTAGLRESDDTVERIGIERAWDEIASADVVLFLHDLTRQGEPAYAAEDARIAERLPAPVPRIDLWNKSDLADAAPAVVQEACASLHLSAKTGTGLEALRRHLLETVGWRSADEGIFMARERHVQALAAVAGHLDIAAEHLAAQAQSLDLLAEELRLAQQALNEITGEFTSDDLLGEIFSRFCIGK
ncbi:MAG: tRNA modification GTPase MnmE [Paracidovorax wautersii]|uniref:tRNA modification GTPase MnmE n=1 Tax=Paracidovorax wautersii TaxID=1177982 RepID=A0A7V8FPL3_9BURK|nr:MAG: tRNA modification GTPase MnmE [Paracidovorax wautersii]